MMYATIVTSDEEIEQIIALSCKNNKTNLSAETKATQGFISWQYSYELLQQMHALHSNIIVKDGDKLAGYAMVALKEASAFHTDLAEMIYHLEALHYNGKKLNEYDYYIMGQVCVAENYRGKGVFDMLYQHHKKLFSNSFDFVVTEISAANLCSIRAHEKAGFKTIHTYTNEAGEWKVVLWDWK
ncbi:hypothetical protein BH11BAC6_BH11BAC6_14170 [soil metagenome]